MIRFGVEDYDVMMLIDVLEMRCHASLFFL